LGKEWIYEGWIERTNLIPGSFWIKQFGEFWRREVAVLVRLLMVNGFTIFHSERRSNG